jgi:putative GTP pyrophosphokinase
MNEAEILARWNDDREMYCAWGAIVEETVVADLAAAMPGKSISRFLRLPSKARPKSGSSLVEKALYRGKAYTNPYNDITDKVGVRFVVLLTSDIPILERIIEQCPLWTADKDRDFLQEQEKNPIHFTYSAVHYIVRNREELKREEITISAGTPCEVQVKTILQHAYSELTHDTIYKPMVEATTTMMRSAAKSMALIEATNDYFELVTKNVEEALAEIRAVSDGLGILYQELVGQEPEVTRAEGVILESYKDLISEGTPQRVREFLVNEKPYVPEKVLEKATYRLLFRQPSILLVYYLAATNKRDAIEKWPLTPEEIRPVFVDLGIRFEL